MKKTVLALALTSFVLLGCGGGGSDTPSKTTTVQGKVIDGYIVGATVFLDLNFNSTLDVGEPSTITDESGSFSLTGDTSCAAYVPTFTHVPVGAIDLDYPDTPIEKAYTMVSPPSILLSINEDLLNLTPLTSIVWNSVEQELSAEGATLSCQSIMNNQATRDDIAERLKQQEFRIADRYNITVNDLYGDYVASGNSELHSFAQDLVPGLQASYSETLELETQYPTAEIAFVEYFLEVVDATNDWYRREVVGISNGNWSEVTHAVSNDLSEKLIMTKKHSQTTTWADGIEFLDDITFSLTGTAENPEYSCSVHQEYLQTTDISYGINNHASREGITNWEDCVAIDRVTNSTSHSLETRTGIYSDEFMTHSKHRYSNGATSGMEHLLAVVGNVENFDGKVFDELSFISTDFNNSESHGASSWNRTENDFTDSINPEIFSFHDSNDNYSVRTTHKDGTHTSECGTWSGGLIGACE